MTLLLKVGILTVRREKETMSEPTVVLLYKDPVAFQWSFLINHQKYTITTPKSALLEQMVYVITDLKDLFNLHGEAFTICSPSLIRNVLYDLTLIFPTVNFVPLADHGVNKVFKRVLNHAGKPRKNNPVKGTVFICSDASKASNTTLCGWAWYSTAGGDSGFDFGVTEHRSIVHAELEGILRAIVSNRNNNFTTLHVSCDSKQSVDWANDLLFSRIVKDYMITPLTPTMKTLYLQARQVAKEKAVRLQWVKGHKNHRLNTAADYLSREARLAAHRHERLDRTSPQVTGVLSFMS